LEPPIDIDSDRPGIDGRPFRGEHAVSDSELLIVTVSRLSLELKLDALVDAIDAVAILAAGLPVRLLIVGDGDARAHLEERAQAVNEQSGRPTVSFAGALTDPRPAYAAADIVLGMGSSALRAMAFGKPVIVQGVGGFSLPFSSETENTFLFQGFWGVGPGGSGAAGLARHLETLAVDPQRRSRLGAYGRATVVERFSLRRGANIMEEIYTDVADVPGRHVSSAREAARIAARALRLEVHQHRPSVKRKRALDERARLDAAATRRQRRK
jgi:glycosyltransferase involved in cell wall biosynthesis